MMPFDDNGDEYDDDDAQVAMAGDDNGDEYEDDAAAFEDYEEAAAPYEEAADDPFISRMSEDDD